MGGSDAQAGVEGGGGLAEVALLGTGSAVAEVNAVLLRLEHVNCTRLFLLLSRSSVELCGAENRAGGHLCEPL